MSLIPNLPKHILFGRNKPPRKPPERQPSRIVCANCHLAQKPAEIEIPHSVLPDSVFEAVVKIPHDPASQQVLGDGSKGGLNVGAVLMLPDGFKSQPPIAFPKKCRKNSVESISNPTKKVKITWLWSARYPGINTKKSFSPFSPHPSQNKGIHFGKYAVHLVANCGRGQVYPTGEPSNNNAFKASTAGTISQISKTEAGGL
jgi:apocytochrome f